MGMIFQLLRDRSISSRGPGLHTAKVEPRRQKHAHQRQSAMRETALWRTGQIRPRTHTHKGTHTQTDRKRERNTQRLRDRERRENERHTHRHTQTHIDTHTHTYTHRHTHRVLQQRH
uniref:Uncharacterized protein n=1 Tax=Pan troglodytes TaxID=9598 RepID=A0A2I3RD12_PANTR